MINLYAIGSEGQQVWFANDVELISYDSSAAGTQATFGIPTVRAITFPLVLLSPTGGTGDISAGVTCIYALEDGFPIFIGKPVNTRIDTSNDTLEISAESLWFYFQKKRVIETSVAQLNIDSDSSTNTFLDIIAQVPWRSRSRVSLIPQILSSVSQALRSLSGGYLNIDIQAFSDVNFLEYAPTSKVTIPTVDPSSGNVQLNRRTVEIEADFLQADSTIGDIVSKIASIAGAVGVREEFWQHPNGIPYSMVRMVSKSRTGVTTRSVYGISGGNLTYVPMAVLDTYSNTAAQYPNEKLLLSGLAEIGETYDAIEIWSAPVTAVFTLFSAPVFYSKAFETSEVVGRAQEQFGKSRIESEQSVLSVLSQNIGDSQKLYLHLGLRLDVDYEAYNGQLITRDDFISKLADQVYNLGRSICVPKLYMSYWNQVADKNNESALPAAGMNIKKQYQVSDGWLGKGALPAFVPIPVSHELPYLREKFAELADSQVVDAVSGLLVTKLDLQFQGAQVSQYSIRYPIQSSDDAGFSQAQKEQAKANREIIARFLADVACKDVQSLATVGFNPGGIFSYYRLPKWLLYLGQPIGEVKLDDNTVIRAEAYWVSPNKVFEYLADDYNAYVSKLSVGDSPELSPFPYTPGRPSVLTVKKTQEFELVNEELIRVKAPAPEAIPVHAGQRIGTSAASTESVDAAVNFLASPALALKIPVQLPIRQVIRIPLTPKGAQADFRNIPSGYRPFVIKREDIRPVVAPKEIADILPLMPSLSAVQVEVLATNTQWSPIIGEWEMGWDIEAPAFAPQVNRFEVPFSVLTDEPNEILADFFESSSLLIGNISVSTTGDNANTQEQMYAILPSSIMYETLDGIDVFPGSGEKVFDGSIPAGWWPQDEPMYYVDVIDGLLIYADEIAAVVSKTSTDFTRDDKHSVRLLNKGIAYWPKPNDVFTVLDTDTSNANSSKQFLVESVHLFDDKGIVEVRLKSSVFERTYNTIYSRQVRLAGYNVSVSF